MELIPNAGTWLVLNCLALLAHFPFGPVEERRAVRKRHSARERVDQKEKIRLLPRLADVMLCSVRHDSPPTRSPREILFSDGSCALGKRSCERAWRIVAGGVAGLCAKSQSGCFVSGASRRLEEHRRSLACLQVFHRDLAVRIPCFEKFRARGRKQPPPVTLDISPF